ncbi:hypothetical protein G5I_05420 [Acromyrmex echinatior]|uniref:Uncharacterized protein n=1 Tax=Acromyrmex echinatior TaxID=103372 RepID=F4WI98_ACREC|nr:hypothetical protein G5I_05420 [Acromyrmex echinatior]
MTSCDQRNVRAAGRRAEPRGLEEGRFRFFANPRAATGEARGPLSWSLVPFRSVPFPPFKSTSVQVQRHSAERNAERPYGPMPRGKVVRFPQLSDEAASYSISVVRDQWEMIRREMDNVETGLSVKVIEEVDEPTGSLMLLEQRTDKKVWLVEN